MSPLKRIYLLAGLLLVAFVIGFTVFLGLHSSLLAIVKSELDQPAKAKIAESITSPPTWIVLGGNNRTIARTITHSASCPTIEIDGKSFAMQTRTQPSNSFPVLSCEFPIPAEAESVQIAAQSLPLPKPNPRRIAVIGDTGCRLKGKQVQACNDPQQWGFPRIAQTVADWKPDLVIHVGDYLYRESPCPKNNAGCVGSAAGDIWQAWDQDFFSAAHRLLRAAPWIMARGNHELCNRGGNGWFYLLDPRKLPSKCQDYSDLYKVSLGLTDVIVMDSALADDIKVVPEQATVYEQQFQQLQTMAHKPTWLLIHRPIWGIGQAQGIFPLTYATNQTLQAASKNQLPDAVSLILSGHIHIFEMLDFADQRPPQSITGNSGTALDAEIFSALPGRTIAGTKVSHGTSIGKFGFMTLEQQDNGRWVGTARDVDGSAQANCVIQDKQVICRNLMPT